MVVNFQIERSSLGNILSLCQAGQQGYAIVDVTFGQFLIKVYYVYFHSHISSQERVYTRGTGRRLQRLHLLCPIFVCHVHIPLKRLQVSLTIDYRCGILFKEYTAAIQNIVPERDIAKRRVESQNFNRAILSYLRQLVCIFCQFIQSLGRLLRIQIRFLKHILIVYQEASTAGERNSIPVVVISTNFLRPIIKLPHVKIVTLNIRIQVYKHAGLRSAQTLRQIHECHIRTCARRNSRIHFGQKIKEADPQILYINLVL